ncbi:MAG TPA: transglutaminase family protein, partial [Polyangiaceae bacterium]|nr:transglutaminase family protein [Polyangiaceae bacterium]
FVRLHSGEPEQLKINYEASVEAEVSIIDASELAAVTVQSLDNATLPYLFPSRYCQSDMLGRLAWNKFGKIDNAYERVVAVTDWIYGNVEYVSGSTNANTSAYDTVTQRAGVCRDFAHLGVSLCRALNIPARYFTGYAYQLDPPDFHACFEAFIGGRWTVFDATRLAPLNGLVRIATGRDAADTSLATIFGPVKLKGMQVGCAFVGEGFKPLTRAELGHKGVTLEKVV